MISAPLSEYFHLQKFSNSRLFTLVYQGTMYEHKQMFVRLFYDEISDIWDYSGTVQVKNKIEEACGGATGQGVMGPIAPYQW